MADRIWRRTYGLLCIALGAAGLIGIVGYEASTLNGPREGEAAPIESAVSLRLMSGFGPAYAGEMVALRSGLFKREGLSVALQSGRDDLDPITSVVNGVDTFGVTRADSFVAARKKGAPIVAFSASFIDSDAVFFVLKKSNLRTPQDFIGHRVGRRAGDDTETVYNALTHQFGLQHDKITEVPVTNDLAMLVRGDVEVWPGHIGNEDYALDRQGVDYFVIDPANYGIHLTGGVYFARDRTVLDQPEPVRHFLSGVIAGWNAVYQDYASSVPLIASFDESRLSPDYVSFTLDQQRKYLRPISIRLDRLKEDKSRGLEMIMITQRLIERTVNLSDGVTDRFLNDLSSAPFIADQD
jgi:ABC-type nitrate/sulfonate/bicarbonate transport system substrate-binding protein